MSTFSLLQFLDHFELFLSNYQATDYQRCSAVEERITWEHQLFSVYTLLKHTLETTNQDIPYFDPVLRSKYHRIAELIRHFNPWLQAKLITWTLISHIHQLTRSSSSSKLSFEYTSPQHSLSTFYSTSQPNRQFKCSHSIPSTPDTSYFRFTDSFTHLWHTIRYTDRCYKIALDSLFRWYIPNSAQHLNSQTISSYLKQFLRFLTPGKSVSHHHQGHQGHRPEQPTSLLSPDIFRLILCQDNHLNYTIRR